MNPTYPVGQLVTTPTPLSAAPSAPPPHCQLTGHHSIPTVGRLVIAPAYPVSRLVIIPSPLSTDRSLLQHTLSADWSPLQPHCRPTGHHSIPTVSRQVIAPAYPVSQLVIIPSPLLADWSSLQPHCQPTGHCSSVPCWLPY